jgi:hypothetical protein
MYALDIRARPEPQDVVSLAELADLEADLSRRWPDLPDPLILEWSDAHVVALDGGEAWTFGPAEDDPLRDRRGRSLIPRQQRAQLKATAESGVPFQRLAVAHQLEPTGPVRFLMPTLAFGARTCTDDIAKALVGPVPEHPKVALAVRLLDAAVGGALSSAGRATALLDPILFGIIAPSPPRHGDACLWYPLAAWRW